MKPAVFHEDAEAELDAAVAYYESQLPGLGVDMLNEVMQAVHRIILGPRTYPQYGVQGIRQCRIHRFPYTVFFHELEDRVWIVAIAHQRRKPGYWKQRKVP